MKTRFFTTIVLLFLLQSCKHINSSGYQMFDPNSTFSKAKYMEQLHILSHEKVNETTVFNSGLNKYIYKINTEEILEIADKNKYTWLHIWLPYCPNDNCVNIGQYEALEKKYKDKGLELLFTSKTYNMRQIFTLAENSDFTLPIYVLDGEYYGYKLKDISQKLYTDLNSDAKEDDYIFHRNYVFKGDSLIYMGNDINDSILDNLILGDKVQL